MRLKKISSMIVGISVAINLLACGKTAPEENTPNEVNQSAETNDAGIVSRGPYSYEKEFSERDLVGTYDATNVADTIQLSDGEIYTIASSGTYVFSGTASEGQIVVDAEDAKVQIVLNGVDITNSAGPVIYVKSADKVFVTLADGSNNTFRTTGEFQADGDTNVDGTIFSKSDLTINGSGALSIDSTEHGIVGKDDVKICGGDLVIKAAGHAIEGKDSIRLASSGSMILEAGKDGLHAGNDEEDEKGYIYIYEASLTINCESDAIDAEYICQIDGGILTISAGDDAIHADGDLYYNDGKCEVLSCYEGLEGSTITVNGGDIDINASDDGMNAAGDSIAGNPPNMSEGAERNDMFPQDDRMPGMWEGNAEPDGGPGGKPGEVPSGEPGERPGGEPSGEPRERPGEKPGGGFGGNMGGGMMDGNDAYVLTINGGNICIKANGDGLDSNGLLYINGGTIFVEGPTNDGNASIDFGTNAYINGGSVIAIGSSGMVENFAEASSQGIITFANTTISAGDEVMLLDANGNILLSCAASIDCTCAQFSCHEIKAGETYTIQIGDTTTEIMMESAIYSNVSGFGRPR
ncbi:MAG: carbohydrate-binding domain-containing protein [Lachnospiraceae bacterium]|nr:carbohydrate-binding domain-containing protein [Lachnospiraceae bacterium]